MNKQIQIWLDEEDEKIIASSIKKEVPSIVAVDRPNPNIRPVLIPNFCDCKTSHIRVWDAKNDPIIEMPDGTWRPSSPTIQYLRPSEEGGIWTSGRFAAGNVEKTPEFHLFVNTFWNVLSGYCEPVNQVNPHTCETIKENVQQMLVGNCLANKCKALNKCCLKYKSVEMYFHPAKCE